MKIVTNLIMSNLRRNVLDVCGKLLHKELCLIKFLEIISTCFRKCVISECFLFCCALCPHLYREVLSNQCTEQNIRKALIPRMTYDFDRTTTINISNVALSLIQILREKAIFSEHTKRITIYCNLGPKGLRPISP